MRCICVYTSSGRSAGGAMCLWFRLWACHSTLEVLCMRILAVFSYLLLVCLISCFSVAVLTDLGIEENLEAVKCIFCFLLKFFFIMEISLAKKRVISYSVSYKVLFSGTDNNIEGSRNCLPSACAQPPKGKFVLWASFTESFIFQGSEEFSVFLKNLSWKRLQEKMVRCVRVKNLPTFFCGISMWK